LLQEFKLRVFWVAGRRDLSTWDWLVRVVRQWKAIEETIDQRGEGPWFYAINEVGLREVPLA
jgi:hypothetical protein